MTPRPALLLLVALVLTLALAGCGERQPETQALSGLPPILAEHQFFPVEEGFLRSIGDLDTPRSDADLVNAGQAACAAIHDDGATRADLAPALSQWAQIDEATANRVLTAASANMCETALLFDR